MKFRSDFSDIGLTVFSREQYCRLYDNLEAITLSYYDFIIDFANELWLYVIHNTDVCLPPSEYGLSAASCRRRQIWTSFHDIRMPNSICENRKSVAIAFRCSRSIAVLKEHYVLR